MAQHRVTPQQLKLIEGYVAGKSVAAAALEAGYTQDGAGNAYRTLKLPHVAAELQRQLDEAMTAREVLHRIGRKARDSDDETIQMDALKTLAKYHKLLIDKVEHDATRTFADLVLAAQRQRESEAAETVP